MIKLADLLIIKSHELFHWNFALIGNVIHKEYVYPENTDKKVSPLFYSCI